ncbi:MAG: F0F1 ATP synthase subunit A [Proteobacteria bacterium]|nr:F0F1 ATP synthase subunit A [Pseudomonadota bacterium]
MKHPFMFLVDLFDVNGSLYHYSHLYKQVPYTWLIMIILIGLGALATKKISLVPSKGQNVFELLISGLEEFMVDIVGEEGRWFLPLAATIFIFIFVSNLSGLIPGFFPPTASINTNLGCALVVFIFTHYLGVKHHGAHYVKHFMGPVWWMVPLIMPIEIIGHLARVLSLTFRLFGNMAGHELVLMILFTLAGAYFAPLPIMALGIFVAFVQAFVFFLLSIIYFSGSIEHAH